MGPGQPSAEASAASEGAARVPKAGQEEPGASDQASATDPGASGLPPRNPGPASRATDPGGPSAVGLAPHAVKDAGRPGSAPVTRDDAAGFARSPQAARNPASAVDEARADGAHTEASDKGNQQQDTQQEEEQQQREPSTSEGGTQETPAPAPIPDPTAGPAAAADTDSATAGSASAPAGPSPEPSAASSTGLAMSPDGSPRKRELRFGRNANKRYTPSPTRISPSPEPPAEPQPPSEQPSADGTPPAPGDAAMAAAAAAAASLSPRPSSRLSTTGGPHTAEALFNPAADEPLIPSLALHRRGSAAEPELLPHGFSPRSTSPPAQQDSHEQGQRASEAGADGSRPATVMTAASSEPPSVMPSPHVTLTRSDVQPAAVSPMYAGYVMSADGGTTLAAGHLPSEASFTHGEQQAPQPPHEQQEDQSLEASVSVKELEQPSEKRAPSPPPPPPPPPPQLEALTFRLDDKYVFCHFSWCMRQVCAKGTQRVMHRTNGRAC